MGFFLFDAVSRTLRSRRRKERLQVASLWPTTSAKLLPSKLVMKDDLAEGTAIQDTAGRMPPTTSASPKVTLAAMFAALRAPTPKAGESSANWQKIWPIVVRYNPANPDEGCVLAEDNAGTLPFTVWPG